MPNTRKPRSGSLQFWPRKRSKRAYPRIRARPEANEPGLQGFAGYKVGMTHVLAIETRKHSHKKGRPYPHYCVKSSGKAECSFTSTHT